MLFLSGLVFVVELVPRGYGESRMHRNGFGFTGHRTGTPNVAPVSPAFNCDEFALPSLSSSSTARQVRRPVRAWLGSERGQSSPEVVCSRFLFCLSAGSYQREGPRTNPGKPIHGFKVNLALLFQQF